MAKNVGHRTSSKNVMNFFAGSRSLMEPHNKENGIRRDRWEAGTHGFNMVCHFGC